jgi:hypothetical protein
MDALRDRADDAYSDLDGALMKGFPVTVDVSTAFRLESAGSNARNELGMLRSPFLYSAALPFALVDSSSLEVMRAMGRLRGLSGI